MASKMKTTTEMKMISEIPVGWRQPTTGKDIFQTVSMGKYENEDNLKNKDNLENEDKLKMNII